MHGKLFVFGSVLNCSRPSDIDLILVIDEQIVPPKVAYLLALPLRRAIEQSTSLPLDLTIQTRREIQRFPFVEEVDAKLIHEFGEVWTNKSLQVTFDPPPTFAVEKAGVASNAPELRRWAS